MPERDQTFQTSPLKEVIQTEPAAYHNPEFTFNWHDYIIRFKKERPDDQLQDVGGKVLEVITRRKNTVIPYDHYRKLVWDSPHFSPTNLRTNISNLRKRIDANPATFNIRAVPDLGYILQDHNWATEAKSIPLVADGTLRYYPDTRDFAANNEIVPLTKVEAHIIQTVAQSIDAPVRTHHLNLHGHGDRHSKRSTSVHIHKLNKKLQIHGVRIKPIKNFGYQLEVGSPKR